MAAVAAAHARVEEAQPRLVFFHSALSGNCRRVEGFLAQVLQRRRNHETFRLYNVAKEDRPDLLDRFEIERIPTLVVVEGKTVRARLESPRGCREIERFLAPWLH
ncbi:MAG: thioredoxin family protein [Actinomycetota bacterium]|nr:thioredoxin family protein [Actinomycetota bacterium]